MVDRETTSEELHDGTPVSATGGLNAQGLRLPVTRTRLTFGPRVSGEHAQDPPDT